MPDKDPPPGPTDGPPPDPEKVAEEVGAAQKELEGEQPVVPGEAERLANDPEPLDRLGLPKPDAGRTGGGGG